MGAIFNPISRTLSNSSRAEGGAFFCPPLLDQPYSMRKTKKNDFLKLYNEQ